MPATSGPPNSAEIAENAPAPERTTPSCPPSRTMRCATTPTADPSAITGTSGPSTAPNASVPTAASTTPGTNDGGVGAALNPSSGRWPPSPGRNARARMTSSAPRTGSPSTRNHGGAAYPSEAGSSCHSQSSSPWIKPRKSAAASAAGIPMRAAMPTRRRYSVADGGRLGRAIHPRPGELSSHRWTVPPVAGRAKSRGTVPPLGTLFVVAVTRTGGSRGRSAARPASPQWPPGSEGR